MKSLFDPPKKLTFAYYLWRTCMSATVALGVLSILTLAYFLISSALGFTSGYVWIACMFMSFIAITGAIIEASKPINNSSLEKLGYISLMLISGATVTVVGYGILYEDNGILGVDNPVPTLTAQYFSMVTFTTLGYGDLKPTDSLRIFAASEAIIGYIYLGLIVGLFSGVISKTIGNSNLNNSSLLSDD